MKYYFVILLFIINNYCIAVEQTPNASPPTEAVALEKPSLGTCDEYTDYYIYQCTPFKCTLPIAGIEKASREMETIALDNGKCIHNITMYARHEKFRPANFYINCKLSPEGRADMADLFTRYKNGDIKVYQKRIMTETLQKECR